MANSADRSAAERVLDESSTVIVLTTWPADRDAAEVARALVEGRLAACVNVLPEMRSHYAWKGEICAEGERQLVVKTTRQAVPRLFEKLRTLHPYDVPEFLVLPVAAGSASYLAWVAGSVSLERP